MRKRHIKLWGTLAAAVMLVSTFSTPAYAVDEEAEAISVDTEISEQELSENSKQPNESYEIVWELEEQRMQNAHVAEGISWKVLQGLSAIEMDSAEQLMQVLEERVAGPTDIAVTYELQTFSVGTEVVEERYTVYDSIGRAVAGWVEDDGGWYYIDGNGNYASGWRNIDGNTYYFDTSTNYMVHGWLPSGGYYYYMGYPGAPDPGAMYMSGWLNDTEGGGTASDPLWYYLDTDGTMRHGWLYDGGYYYYMGYPGAPLSGVMYNHGWMEDTDGTWYYFEESGARHHGWLRLSGYDYYLGDDGKMRTGTQELSEYIGAQFNADGELIEDSWIYYPVYLQDGETSSLNTRFEKFSYYSEDNVGYMRNSITVNPTIFNRPSTYPAEEASIPNSVFTQFDYSNTEQTVDLVSTTSSSADIIYQMHYMWSYSIDAAAITFRQNKDGEWDILPETGWPGEFVNGEIDNVIIAINSSYVSATSQNFEYVCLHEMGHAVGLQHTYESGSGDTPVNIPALMDPKADSSYARDYLTSWDKEELLKKYPQ